ncbi:MAG: enoyl-CoA hydratase [Pirellulales bacterium]|nr:enoyl-CoA hydratase [Pirellulales bacterium]
MAQPLVLLERTGAIAVLVLNHPEKRNALSRAVLTALADRLREIAADPSIKCVIVRAVGPVFSSGHDLNEVRGAAVDELESLFVLCSEVMETIRRLRVPVIAEVAGVATAAGCQLAATCDLVIAAEEATFATPGVKIGLFCSTPAVAVSRAVPAKKAMEMLLTGEAISAAEAERVGLVNRVVPREQLSAATLALAEKVASASGATVALGKRAFYEQLGVDRPRAYEIASRAMVENAQLPDADEGIGAFLEKRSAKWST